LKTAISGICHRKMVSLLTYLEQMPCLGKLSNPKNHEFSRKLQTFSMLQITMLGCCFLH